MEWSPGKLPESTEKYPGKLENRNTAPSQNIYPLRREIDYLEAKLVEINSKTNRTLDYPLQQTSENPVLPPGFPKPGRHIFKLLQ
jgi:hypothetical protein